MRNFHKTPIPVNYFSIVLGVTAYGIAWRYGAHIGLLSATIGEIIIAIGACLWLWFVSAYLYKWFKFTEHAQNELAHIILCCYISLIPITTLLMAIAVGPYSHKVSFILTVLGIAIQLAFAAYRAAGLWKGIHKIEATTPIVYLPAVAGNFVSASALGALGYHDWGMLFFGAGLFSWLSLEPAILQRLRNQIPVEAASRPVIGIQLAPAFVACMAYLANNGGAIDIPVQLLYGYGILQLLFLLRLLPWIAENGFSLGFWGFSFGLAAMAGCSLHIYHELGHHGIGIIAIPLFLFASVAVLILSLLTIRLAWQGKFIPRNS